MILEIFFKWLMQRKFNKQQEHQLVCIQIEQSIRCAFSEDIHDITTIPTELSICFQYKDSHLRDLSSMLS